MSRLGWLISTHVPSSATRGHRRHLLGPSGMDRSASHHDFLRFHDSDFAFPSLLRPSSYDALRSVGILYSLSTSATPDLACSVIFFFHFRFRLAGFQHLVSDISAFGFSSGLITFARIHDTSASGIVYTCDTRSARLHSTPTLPFQVYFHMTATGRILRCRLLQQTRDIDIVFLCYTTYKESEDMHLFGVAGHSPSPRSRRRV